MWSSRVYQLPGNKQRLILIIFVATAVVCYMLGCLTSTSVLDNTQQTLIPADVGTTNTFETSNEAHEERSSHIQSNISGTITITYLTGTLRYVHGDGPIAKALTLFGSFDPEQLQIFDLFVTKGATVVDVGANIGVFSVWFASRVGETGKLYAFEVQPTVSKLLASNLFDNGVSSRAIVVNVALGSYEDARSCVRFTPHHSASGSTSVEAASVPCVGKQPACTFNNLGFTCPVSALDNTGILKVDFLKVDAERMDSRVLAGGIKMIKLNRPVIYSEYHDVKRTINNDYPRDSCEFLCALPKYVVYVHSFVTGLGARKAVLKGRDASSGSRETNALGIPSERHTNQLATELTRQGLHVKDCSIFVYH